MIIGSIVLVQFVGIPCAFLFGALAGRIGAKWSIALGLVVYVAICVVGYHMKTGLHFLFLAFLVGVVQGGTQALSRSLFASMVPRDKSGEFFGFFGTAEKFAGIFGRRSSARSIAGPAPAEARSSRSSPSSSPAACCCRWSMSRKVSAWPGPRRPRISPPAPWPRSLPSRPTGVERRID
jgi:hypothetical protein